METFNCVPNVTKSKFRPNLTNNFYHNVPRNMRPIGSEYALPNCTGRRSLPSITHTFPWQERPPPTPVSCIGIERKSSRGKLCSIALAIASFVVLVAVLAIAGLALYMGILHTETPNALLTFSCSAKVLRGDRFVAGFQDKARRYKRQFETLYQRSILGPSFLSCVVDRFGNDTFTVYFKLAFNRRKLSKNVSNIEKAIKDILLTDAISRNSVFKNVRFDPRYVTVRQILSNEIAYHAPSVVSHLPSDTKNGAITTKTSVVLKPHNKTSHIPMTRKPIIIKEIEGVKDAVLPVVQGSFKISKTDADITEKKTEISTEKPKVVEKTTIPFIKKSTFKDSAVTSSLYKIAAVEKVTKLSTNPRIESTTGITSTTTVSTTSTTTVSIKPSISIGTKKPLFIANPFDEEPWIPILPNLAPVTEKSPILSNTKLFANPTLLPESGIQPTYTSFTNPGLSFNFNEAERLGSTSLKSHPIPVNKIPLTEPSVFSISKINQTPITTKISDPSMATFENSDELNSSGYIEIETVKYVPEANKNNIEQKHEETMKNISSIFHNLASSLDNSKVNLSLTDIFAEDNFKKLDDEQSSGQGQVEVVIDDVEDLVLHTTKVPLVTLLPVKSNSGIGRPIRKRPHKPGDPSPVENRSFPNYSIFSNNQNDNMRKEDKTGGSKDNFRIMGILNFATEEPVDSPQEDIIRYPKMDSEISIKELKTESSTFINASMSAVNNNSNILTPEEIMQLSQISNIFENSSIFESEPVISTKAISSSHTTNQNGIHILSKPLHKITSFTASENVNKANYSECTNTSVVCGDGTCLPDTTKCNQLIDCNDGKDELDCSCADYLKSQFLLGKICDGVVDCWDYSDESNCDWCQADQYVCSNSKVCIEKAKLCNGIKECPQGDDERQCVTIAHNIESAEGFPYLSEGYLMVRKYGQWGKLCIDNFENVVSISHISWQIPDLGKAVCKSMTYQNMESIKTVMENEDAKKDVIFFELAYNSQNETKSSLSFKSSTCTNKQTVRVKCQSLECGARPQVVKHIARVVGGGNAGLGAWPWQAALYKEGEFQCGATLLSNRWLVSAGHCFYHSQDEYWVARLGALRRGTALPSPYEQLRSVVRIVVHPGYVDSGFINDISLLQLETPVVFSDYVRPVCLPQPHQSPVDGRLCTVVGWGQLFEVGRIFPDTLQEVQVPIISTAECRKRTLFLPLYRITDDMFCAGYERGGRDACLGDSGGPLMCPESNGRWTLHGITSNGYGCARANRPGVYTQVASYVGWINYTIYNDEMNNNNVTRRNFCSGHRCPLGECLPENRLCNGYLECSDGSDEKNCSFQKQ